MVEPMYGLGNRLHAVFSALVLAQEVGAELEVRWRPHPYECNASWQQLFEPWDRIVVREEADAGALADVVSSVGVFRDADGAAERLRRGERVQIRAYSPFRLSGMTEERRIELARVAVRTLRPTADVRERVPAVPTGSVGFHLRGTDNWMALRHSPPRVFVRLGRELLASGAVPAIFVVADDEPTLVRLRREVGGLTINRPNVRHQRTDPEAIVDALADILTLARCVRVHGSAGSSFATAAQYFGQAAVLQLTADGRAHPHPGSAADRWPPRFLTFDPERRRWWVKRLFGARRWAYPVSFLMLCWAVCLGSEWHRWGAAARRR